MHLHYAGVCKVCGQPLDKGAFAYWDAGARTLTCERIECARADGLTETMRHGFDGMVEVIRESSNRIGRVGAPAPVHPNAVRTVTTRFNSGQSYTRNARGRCIDAPCCGCCD